MTDAACGQSREKQKMKEATLTKGDIYDSIISKLEELDSGDTEASHQEADKLLCALLRKLGYAHVVEAWEKVPKWYA